MINCISKRMYKCPNEIIETPRPNLDLIAVKQNRIQLLTLKLSYVLRNFVEVTNKKRDRLL